MADVPHLSLPLRVVNGRFAVVEQDSPAEIEQAVETVLRYDGELEATPSFGRPPDLAMLMNGPDPEALVEAVERWEPRARVLVEEDRSALADMQARLRVTVETS